MFATFFRWLENNYRNDYSYRRRDPPPTTPSYSSMFDFRFYDDDNTESEDEMVAETVVPEAAEVVQPKPIKVKKVDLEIDDNTEAHHTDQYEITDVDDDNPEHLPDLVIRRGQEFNITVQLSRKFDEEIDAIKIVFETSNNPSPRNGTLQEMEVEKELEANKQWSAAFNPDKPPQDDTVHIKIKPSAKAIVSKWVLKVVCRLRKKPEGERLRMNEFKCKRSVYILFNVWCPEDAVYMDDEDWRDECVIQDDGYVYRGNRRRNGQYGKAWQFSQFEDFVLDCCLHLLDMKRELLPFAQQGNPILVARELAAAVNSSDDNGVLTGNWSGDYTGGARPTSWSNSADILEQFWTTKRPVKFGQCWVFSAVLTTVCRALGLPCRSITNYASAHDTDLSCTIDTFFDEDGKKIDWRSTDSVWNFHVWNEVWMTRPDLGPEHGGWQVIDATPQELSGAEKEFKCGPASKYAILQGEIGLPYDTGFVFGETSAQRFSWTRDPDTHKFIVTGPNVKAVVGVEISTKKPQKTLSRWANHREARLVVTSEYKFDDDTEERKASLINATSKGSADKNFYNASPPDVEVDMLDFGEDIIVGNPFKVHLKILNTSSEPRTMNGHVGICSCFNNSTPYKRLKNKIDIDETLDPNSEMEHVLEVEAEDYEGLVTDGCSFLVWFQGLIKETKQPILEDRSYDLVIPELEINGPEKVSPGDEVKLIIKFKNPMHIRLQDCDFKVSCPQLFKQKAFTFRDIKASEEISIQRSYKAKRMHRYTARVDRDLRINVTFDSDQLSDVVGVHTLKLVHK